MRKTAPSVERSTPRSRRLSRMRRERTWWRGLGPSDMGFVGSVMVSSIRGDDGAHALAFEGAGEVAGHQAVDDLDRAADGRVFHEVEDGALDDHVLKVEGLELG